MGLVRVGAGDMGRGDGMVDRENVIEGLEMSYRYSNVDEDNTLVPQQLVLDAIALLKAQEPRVMTLEEVQQHNNQDGCVWFEQPTYNAVAAFVRKDEFEIEVISPYILGEPINHGYWLSSNYNVTWRCWTSRPTDEQRKAVKWDG